MFTMPEESLYVNEDKIGVPYVWMCLGTKEQQSGDTSECYEARWQYEEDSDKKTTQRGIRVVKYAVKTENISISSTQAAKYTSPGEYFSAAVRAKLAEAKGERELESKSADGALTERAGSNKFDQVIDQGMCSKTNGMIMILD